jgi:hypothetical protein
LVELTVRVTAAGALYSSRPLSSGTGSATALTVPTSVTEISSGVINGSLSISVCARISDRPAAGRVITLAWRKRRLHLPGCAAWHRGIVRWHDLLVHTTYGNPRAATLASQ